MASTTSIYASKFWMLVSKIRLSEQSGCGKSPLLRVRQLPARCPHEVARDSPGVSPFKDTNPLVEGPILMTSSNPKSPKGTSTYEF